MASDTALYLDSSALVKLVLRERESAALTNAISGTRLVSTELALVELPRAGHRAVAQGIVGDARLLFERVDRLLRRVILVPLDRGQLVLASSFQDPDLRSLDALHLAAAMTVGKEVAAVVTYDRLLGRVAERHDLVVMEPA